MTSSPSARPPSSRRPPDLDSPEARAFVEGVGAAQVGEVPRPAAIATVPPIAVEPTRELLRPLTLRIPDSLHRNLSYIAENGSKSMNQFAIDALAPAVEIALDKIRRRKELGLD
jgi:hypothetical protein